MLGIAKVVGVVEASDSKWFMGPFGWLLEDITPLRTPIPCRGMQGLWPVSPEAEQAILGEIGSRLPGLVRQAGLVKTAPVSQASAPQGKLLL